MIFFTVPSIGRSEMTYSTAPTIISVITSDIKDMADSPVDGYGNNAADGRSSR